MKKIIWHLLFQSFALTDTSCMEINSILEGQTIPWIDDVDIAVSASELLGIVGQDTPSKQDSGSM